MPECVPLAQTPLERAQGPGCRWPAGSFVRVSARSLIMSELITNSAQAETQRVVPELKR